MTVDASIPAMRDDRVVKFHVSHMFLMFLSLPFGIAGKLYALTTVMSPTFTRHDWCPRIFYFILDQKRNAIILHMARKIGHKPSMWRTVLVPAGFSPVPSLPLFIGHLECSRLGEQNCLKVNFCAHTGARLRVVSTMDPGRFGGHVYAM